MGVVVALREGVYGKIAGLSALRVAAVGCRGRLGKV